MSAEDIVSTAVRIADVDGLDAVSIRRIAAELGVRPMSLYDHFASKEALLDAMADEVVAEVLIPGPHSEHWREALAAVARRNYANYLRHPWLVILFGRRPKWGPNALAVAKQAAEAMRNTPLEPAERWMLHGTVNDYILGHSLRNLASPAAEGLDELVPPEELAEAPELSSLPDSLHSRTSVERFEAGLQMLLDAIEGRISGTAAGH